MPNIVNVRQKSFCLCETPNYKHFQYLSYKIAVLSESVKHFQDVPFFEAHFSSRILIG